MVEEADEEVGKSTTTTLVLVSSPSLTSSEEDRQIKKVPQKKATQKKVEAEIFKWMHVEGHSLEFPHHRILVP